MFAEIMQAFAELGARGPDQTTSASDSVAGATTFLTLLLFSFGSVWAGYKLQTTGRIVAVGQLVVLGWVCQWLNWNLFATAGHPLVQGLVTIAGCMTGIFLKVNDDQRRLLDAQYYELKLRHQELQESRLALVRSDETERRLLAADLHDQVLNDLKQISQEFEQFVASKDPEISKKIDVQIGQVMSEVREIMDNLCPVVLEHFGLAAAIEECLEKGSQRSGFDIRFVQSAAAEKPVSDLSQVEQQLLYRLAQECVTNICKHAEASLVQAAIEIDDADLVFRITDDGRGLDPAKTGTNSRGLVYMRLRAALIGARINWSAGKSGKGTAVEIRLSMPQGIA